VIRDGQEQSFAVSIDSTGLIGVSASTDGIFELRKKEYGFFAAIPAGAKKAFVVARDYLKQFKLIVKPETKAYESLGGFIAIGKIFPGTWDWYSFWSMTSFLSIMLAVLNILPIPALDGGHALFIIIEMVTRRKPSDKVMEVAQYIGFALLLALLIYANGNDIVKLFR
jgi:regulator of sigma E protease